MYHLYLVSSKSDPSHLLGVFAFIVVHLEAMEF